MTKLLYIAGPYRAPTPMGVEMNIREAEAAALELARVGAVPVCVHSMYRFFDKALPDQFWLDATMEVLLRCDGVVLLPTWERSAGARAELAEAARLDLPAWLINGAGYSPVTESTPQLAAWLSGAAPVEAA